MSRRGETLRSLRARRGFDKDVRVNGRPHTPEVVEILVADAGRANATPARTDGWRLALSPACDPDLGLAAVQPWPNRHALGLRVSWLDAAPSTLIWRLSAGPDGRSAAALAFPATGYAAAAAWVAAASPEISAPLAPLAEAADAVRHRADLASAAAAIAARRAASVDGAAFRPSEDDLAAAEALAGRLVAAAQSGRSGPTPLPAADEATFWRRFAAFLHLLPAGLRPAAAAVAGADVAETAAAAGVVVEVPDAPVVAAEREVGSQALERLRSATVRPLQPIDDADAQATLVAAFEATLSPNEAVAAVETFLTALDAPKISAGALADPAALRTILRALHDGDVDGAAATPLALAKAAGLLAVARDAEKCWIEARAVAPARVFWRALSLADSAVEAPIPTLAAFARLRRFEKQLRAAMPNGAKTPFDAPRFEERVTALAARGAMEILLAPLDVAALDGPAVQRFGDALKATADPAVLSSALDAVDLAVETEPAGLPPPLVSRLGEASRILRERSGLAASTRYDRPRFAADAPEAALRFSDAVTQSTIAGRWRGSGFWLSALEGWARAADRRGDTALARRVEMKLSDDAGRSLVAGPALRRLIASAFAPIDAEPSAAVAPSDVAAPTASEAPPPQTPLTLGSGDLAGAHAAEPPKPKSKALGVGLDETIEAARSAFQDGGQGGAGPSSAEPDAGQDAEALADAAELVEGWREEFLEQIRQRAAGGPRAPVRFGGVDKHELAAALTAAGLTARRDPARAAALLGDDVAWLFRQLSGLAAKQSDRPPHEPAPKGVRASWADLVTRGGDLIEERGSVLDEKMFFVFLATKLFQARRAEAVAANVVTDGLRHGLSGTAYPVGLGDETVSFTKHWLRDYLYLGRPGERANAVDALSDAEVSARLDRILLIFSMIACGDVELRDERPADLWQPIWLDKTDEPLKRLSPPESMFDRLGRYLERFADQSGSDAQAFVRLVERHKLYNNVDLGALIRKSRAVPR